VDSSTLALKRYREGGFIQSAIDEIDDDTQVLPLKKYDFY